MKTCPYCAEAVQDAAILCKHCGRDLGAAATTATARTVTPLLTPLPAAPARAGARWVAGAAGALLLFGGGAVAAAAGVLPGVTRQPTAAGGDSTQAASDSAAVTAHGRPGSAGELPGATPEPEPPPPPQVLELVDEGAVEVGAERWLDYGFTVAEDGDVCRLTGRVLGLTGGNKDVEVYVLGADDYLNWRTNPHGEQWRYAGVFSGPRQTATPLDVALPAPGEYHLVVSNRFSVATAKNVQARAHVTCAREAATAGA